MEHLGCDSNQGLSMLGCPTISSSFSGQVSTTNLHASDELLACQSRHSLAHIGYSKGPNSLALWDDVSDLSTEAPKSPCIVDLETRSYSLSEISNIRSELGNNFIELDGGTSPSSKMGVTIVQASPTMLEDQTIQCDHNIHTGLSFDALPRHRAVPPSLRKRSMGKPVPSQLLTRRRSKQCKESSDPKVIPELTINLRKIHPPRWVLGGMASSVTPPTSCGHGILLWMNYQFMSCFGGFYRLVEILEIYNEGDDEF